MLAEGFARVEKRAVKKPAAKVFPRVWDLLFRNHAFKSPGLVLRIFCVELGFRAQGSKVSGFRVCKGGKLVGKKDLPKFLNLKAQTLYPNTLKLLIAGPNSYTGNPESQIVYPIPLTLCPEP